MKKRLFPAVILCLSLILMLSSCGKSLDEEIIGVWNRSDEASEEKSGGYYELYIYEDGTLYVSNPTDISTNDVASWSIVNENILKFSWRQTISSSRSGTDMYEIVSINGDTMKCKGNGRDGVIVYDRVKK